LGGKTPQQHTSMSHNAFEQLSAAETAAAADGQQQLLQLSPAVISDVTSCSSSVDSDPECRPTAFPSLLLLLPHTTVLQPLPPPLLHVAVLL
jgi:hypothetical protein